MRNCGPSVPPLSNGSYRNHYPVCLCSKHVAPGDRASACRGMMHPERIERRSGKGLGLVHWCVACSFARSNRIADDPAQGDDIDTIITLMSKAG